MTSPTLTKRQPSPFYHTRVISMQSRKHQHHRPLCPTGEAGGPQRPSHPLPMWPVCTERCRVLALTALWVTAVRKGCSVHWGLQPEAQDQSHQAEIKVEAGGAQRSLEAPGENLLPAPPGPHSCLISSSRPASLPVCSWPFLCVSNIPGDTLAQELSRWYLGPTWTLQGIKFHDASHLHGPYWQVSCPPQPRTGAGPLRAISQPASPLDSSQTLLATTCSSWPQPREGGDVIIPLCRRGN